jgi:Fe-S cluster assembly scaffold protein SufB
MENYLKSKGLWKEEVKQTIVAGFERELDLATGFLFT